MRKVLTALGAAVQSNASELAVGLGLSLVTVGLWPVAGIGGLAVTGAVIVWLALPSRLPLVVHPSDAPSRRKS